MDNVLVSIVMPVKNTSTFLTECINSILHQTYQDWELITVNDGSKDDSFEILSEFSKQDKRIKVFHNTGSGIIDALRLAYYNSRGNFITRMDSDDVMVSDKLKLMVDSLINSKEGNVALGLVNYFSDEGISEGYAKYETWLNKLTASGDNYKELYKECVIASPCWMVYRSDFEKCGAFNSDFYPEDYDLVFRFYEYQLKCIPSDKVLHLWRDYPSRTSRTHENYANNTFINLKVYHFLRLNYCNTRPLVIWGAGTKGKLVAELMIKKNVPFYWICDNPKKIGKEIYNQKLLAITELNSISNAQSIITVANPNSQKEIKEFFEKRNCQSMVDYFFFC